MPRHATLRSRWVVPVAAPPIENGCVEVADGRIVDVGPFTRHTRTGVTDLGDCALLPGFVNAHTHLELTCYAGAIPSCGLWDWLWRLLALRRRPGAEQREREAVAEGAALSLRAGVTTVGDISRTHLAWPVLRPLPLRKVCFAELICFASEPARTPAELEQKVRETVRDDRLRPGISPHAPYSVTADQLRACVEMARRDRLALTMHVAETPEERQFVEEARGLLFDTMMMLGFLKHNPPPRRPLFEHLGTTGLLGAPALLAHVNYITDRELDRLASSPCSVAYCPRAHRFYRHEPHRFREMLARGINVCVGTDSLAANDSLSILDELRYLHRAHPDVDAGELLAMGTVRGARAIRLDGEIGSITRGKWADLVAIPLALDGPDDAALGVLESAAEPHAVFVAGADARADPRAG